MIQYNLMKTLFDMIIENSKRRIAIDQLITQAML